MNLNEARRNMTTQQLQTWGIHDKNVLNLYASLPREDFIPPDLGHLALTDARLPIGHHQTTFTPKEEAKILEALEMKPTDTVLEIGSGCGFMTACLAKSCQHVYSIDIHSDFTEWTKRQLTHHGVSNVTLMTGNGAKGWDQYASYDMIVITGSLPRLPAAFKSQLKTGGRLFCLLGDGPAMKATLLKREAQGWHHRVLFESCVAPLKDLCRTEKFSF